MLLKINDGNGGWILLDEIDRIHLLSSDHKVRTKDELLSLGAEVDGDNEPLVFIANDCFPVVNGHDLDVGIIEFVRKGKTNTALYTNAAYVLDNSGTTIECFKARKEGRR